MNEIEFNAGDIVTLKSGGPNMTVKEVSAIGNLLIVCQWFAGKKLEAGRFDPASLSPVIADES